MVNTLLIVLVGIGLYFLFLIYSMYKLAASPPKNNPRKFLKDMEKPNFDHDRKRLILIGDSITRGSAGIDYAKLLRRRFKSGEYGITIINAGISGDTVAGVKRRLDQIIACKPDIATILIGTNDVKGSSEDINLERYRVDLTGIVERLKKETSARIAILSIPPVGEEPSHVMFKQSLKFCEVIKEVAIEQKIHYLPLYEKIVDYLKEHPGHPKPPYEKWIFLIFKALFLKVHGISYDKAGKKDGFVLHVDYLHLNSKGVAMIADLIEKFVGNVLVTA